MHQVCNIAIRTKWEATMKKFRGIGVILGMSLLMTGSLQAATLNCVNQNNTNCIPIRTISQEFGAGVSFDKASGIIGITYKGKEIEIQLGSKEATVNGEKKILQMAPQALNGTTYVPIRFIGEALGGVVNYDKGQLTVTIDGITKSWQLNMVNKQAQTTSTTAATGAFSSGTKTVQGRKVNYVNINMNNPNVKVKISTAQNVVTAAASLKSLSGTAKASINGSYFAAYNGDLPLPDGTLVSNGNVLHITDIGSTIGFTSDNKVLIDFVKTRVQGYVNGEEAWLSYRINRHTPDPSATIIYTPEYKEKAQVPSGWTAVVCVDHKVVKYTTQSRTVPENGFLLVTMKPEKFKVGDTVDYKVVYEPKNTSASEWENVVHALSAGPSLIINGQKTGDPAKESFTEAKILTQSAQRSFIGVNAQGVVTIGTTTATVSQLKSMVQEMGLVSAMCLDGGASSGLYYNGTYLTSPGRSLSNSINFYA